MLAHGDNLWHNGAASPLYTKYFSELLQVLGRGFSDRENGITQPAHAQAAKLLVKELDTKLASKEWNVFDDGKSNAPLLVFCKLDDCGEK